jgi:hypothetical protein
MFDTAVCCQMHMTAAPVANIEVDPSVKAFDTLRVGDTIHARLTRAVAIRVEAPRSRSVSRESSDR